MDDDPGAARAFASSSSSHHHHVTIVEDPDHRHASSAQFAAEEDHAFGTKIDSSYEGWDNPFRPEGDLSHEAEELLHLWKQGKLRKAPPGAPAAQPGALPGGQPGQPGGDSGGGRSSDKQNGPKMAGNVKNGSKTVDVKRESMPQPVGKVQHVNVGDSGEDKEPKKKHGCCSVM